MSKVITMMAVLILLMFFSKSQGNPPHTNIISQSNVTHSVDRSELLAFAESLLGSPYKYASSNPKKGFDCSGFVSYVFKNFNIAVPRSSGEFKSIGTDLNPEEFKPGDVLVFYSFRNKTRIGHVGIVYEAKGMQSTFIHSSSGKKKGVIISELGSDMYTKRFYRCVDVLDLK